ncbi:hypothetical protein NEOLI_005177 [Neolecta irregularis DAH-3]|uniref:MARVEL domain-containing protein n=1 Tax=Neolecta irregularis (strain DAH-3) TaxID=1198029 RepID=A0A1U7LN75_NEOID|nr:hypothetical protein NEOLI_005177 [Neolecta irregularis DAH-3]|eukprot:OLL24097.1 hypothetical protein NEOLI_005177 [Neolecta irregularis DAH-3]
MIFLQRAPPQHASSCSKAQRSLSHETPVLTMVFEMGNITMILRILQMLFSFLVLALISSAISNRFYYDQDGFLLFTSLLSMASVAYIIFTPIFLAQFHHIFAVMALEGVNVLFWFCGWIAEAASGGRLNCSINVNGFYLFSSSYKQGCGSGKAAAAFGAFTWYSSFIAKSDLQDSLGHHNGHAHTDSFK